MQSKEQKENSQFIVNGLVLDCPSLRVNGVELTAEVVDALGLLQTVATKDESSRIIAEAILFIASHEEILDEINKDFLFLNRAFYNFIRSFESEKIVNV